MKFDELSIKVYADGADKDSLLQLNDNPLIQGMTTNPTLMKQAGIQDYEAFAKEVLEVINEKPISFEVFSDELPEMKAQALKINSWQNNVYVKIPVTNTRGESTAPIIKELAQEGVRLNITAILTLDQVTEVGNALHEDVPSVVSVFAGRIADAGVDAVDLMSQSLEILKNRPQAELLWASVREVYNLVQADQCGCHIVTVPHSIIHKAIKTMGKDLTEYSRDTVQMFYDDATSCGYTIAT